ncbi:MAG TPA: SGNH/GDSL hydrolase family protein [Verrucomicrobiae bacterium]|nr:SGNH/GDSL hydrolase family protein [Verrucomicrobiae bacterium]
MFRTINSPKQTAFFVIALAAGAGLAGQPLRAQNKADSSKWESEIKAIEAADKTNPPPHGAVLFIGSSSIRLWKTLAEDFQEYKVINRGFGGSHIIDSVAFADRIAIPYKPRMILLYAGDNDIAAGKSPEQVLADFKAFTRKVRPRLSETKVAFISIKPSPSRWEFAEKIKAANRLIEDFCRQDERLIYIDVFNPMLGADGKPRPELFVEDRLHLNLKGYALWTATIRSRLKK